MYCFKVAAKLPEDIAGVGWKLFDHPQVNESSHEVPNSVCGGGGGGGGGGGVRYTKSLIVCVWGLDTNFAVFAN